jgi:hypothetical protein
VITVNGLNVQVVRKAIKNLHLGVYPPTGRVRVAAPLALSDRAVRLAVVGKRLHGLSGSEPGSWRSRGSRSARWSAARVITFLGGATACAWWSTKGAGKVVLRNRIILELTHSPHRAASQ